MRFRDNWLRSTSGLFLLLIAGTACIPRSSGNVPELGQGSGSKGRKGGQVAQIDLMNDPSPLLNLVSELRQLGQKRSTPVLFQDDQAFEQMLANAEKLSRNTDSAFDPATLNLALSTLSPLEWGEAEASIGDSGVLGFYDQTARAVVMKRSAAFQKRENGEIVDETAWTLAHEAVHALQEQNFGLPVFDDHYGEDRRLATRAVYEGDAMLGMIAYVEHESFGSLYRKILEFERQGEEEAEQRYRLATGSGSDFDKRPLLQKERVIAPYRDGLRFVGAIYRSGGMEAVNKIYASLPRTTEQVLHVEKYLKGELGSQIEPMKIPEGHRVIASTSVGELLTRASLDQCMAEGTAHTAAAGWNGDQIVLSRDRASHTLLWNTAWDTEADAEEFELAALQMVKCWRRRDRQAKEDAMFSGENVVVRSGARVALVYGLNQKGSNPQVAGPDATEGGEPVETNRPFAAESLATAMLGLKATPESMKIQLASLKYKELEPLRVVRPPYVASGSYINESWNLKIHVPSGVTPKTDEGRLLLEKPEHGFRVVAFQSDFHVNEESNGILYELHRETLAKNAPQVWARDEQSPTPLGNAIHREWVAGREPTSPVVGQLLIIPICEGTGSIILVSEWATAQGKAVSDHVLQNLKPYATGVPPICSRLNPEAPPPR